jgi:primosomal protein N' (replication factor Y)
VDIIIATQAIFRRHDQWKVPLVALLNFDAQMHHTDFRSGHKAFALLVHLKQLSSQKFLVQTSMADSYCIQAIKSLDFNKFYKEELKLRKELVLPPYQHMIALGLRGIKEDSVFSQAQALFDQLDKHKPNGIEVSDPHPDVNPKLRDKYRFVILLKGKSVKPVLEYVKATLKKFKKGSVIITINVDP